MATSKKTHGKSRTRPRTSYPWPYLNSEPITKAEKFSEKASKPTEQAKSSTNDSTQNGLDDAQKSLAEYASYLRLLLITTNLQQKNARAVKPNGNLQQTSALGTNVQKKA